MAKIVSFEAENVKRVKAVTFEPTANGLTIIGGGNGQGKTSVLDAIAWALGGDRFKPSNAKHEGSVTDPKLRIELDNGIIVERKGKNSALKVIDPSGAKGGQALLDSFVEPLALNLPKFMNQSNADKARTLLNIIGVGEQLFELEEEEQALYNQRTAIGQMEKQKRGAASEMSFYPDAPAEPVSASELIRQQQEILAKNGENQRKRDLLMQLCREREEAKREAERIREKIEELRAQHQEIAARHDQLHADVQTAEKTAEQLQDESTAEIEASLQEIDAINQKVRINAARENAIAEADKYKDMYDGLTADIDDVRTRKMKLLEGAELPLEGLTIENKELVYKGSKWDCMSGAEQLMVATAIVRKLNENCEFVLLDKLEQMDLKTLNEFALWAEGQGLQLIATRVSTGDECSILIEDGYSHTVDAALDVEPMTMQEIEEVATTAWQAGVF